MHNLYNLSEKKIFITGGTGGIGSTVVKNLLMRENAEVLFTSSSQEKIDKLISEIPLDKKVHGVVCDMNNSESIINSVKLAIEKMGQIDILVCNAGTNADKLFLRMTIDDWQKVINVNLNGNFVLASAVTKEMFKKRQGKIIFITSIIASIGNPGQVNYCASKAGLEGMMRSLALESARYNINVNAIAPGFIKTEMTDKIPDQIKEAMLKRIPIGHIGETNDVYEMIGFLSSEGAKYITGQTLHVNGGMYLN
jgi:3-oxoacyl-[acyl-carrier protein] reductase